jgi:hypothetical protein
MREISPAINVSAVEFLGTLPSQIRLLVTEIRLQKQAGKRPTPSSTLLDRSTLLTKAHREKLLDAVAALVDENLTGRSEMCLQFADLLHRALLHLKFPARPALGWAIYFGPDGQEIFRWQHAWVRIANEAIDGNVDCLSENPFVPKAVRIAPYWGPITEVPTDRRLREEHGTSLSPDEDVSLTWWPELKSWLATEFLRSDGPLQESSGT